MYMQTDLQNLITLSVRRLSYIVYLCQSNFGILRQSALIPPVLAINRPREIALFNP